MPDQSIPDLAELIATSRCVLAAHANKLVRPTEEPHAVTLAKGVITLFGECAPCGQISPEVYPGEVIITREMVGIYNPTDALAVAATIIRSAREAQGAKV